MKDISLEDLDKKLKIRDINPSYQRVKILEYLFLNQSHPTADKIFTSLQKNIPTLSKTTVYNTLKLFVQSGLVRVITIEDNEGKYDINTENHGHFKCESCGIIYDFDINFDSLDMDNLKDFKIHKKDVFLKGICPTCVGKINLINGGELNGK